MQFEIIGQNATASTARALFLRAGLPLVSGKPALPTTVHYRFRIRHSDVDQVEIDSVDSELDRLVRQQIQELVGYDLIVKHVGGKVHTDMEIAIDVPANSRKNQEAVTTGIRRAADLFTGSIPVAAEAPIAVEVPPAPVSWLRKPWVIYGFLVLGALLFFLFGYVSHSCAQTQTPTGAAAQSADIKKVGGTTQSSANVIDAGNSAVRVNVVAGGGGGPVTVADGADVTQGAIADAAVSGDVNGTLSAKLRQLNKVITLSWDNVNSRINVNIQNIPAVTQSGTWTVQPGNTANTTPWLFTISQGGNAATVSAGGALKVDNSAVTQPISAASLPLPALAATSTKQSDGSQKTQVVDGAGNVISATANALDINIKSGNPTSITANAGTNLNTSALALDATLTNRTQKAQVTDGTRDGTVKAASTAAVATDTALVVAVSPNNSVAVTGTVTTTPPANASTNVAQLAGTATSVNSGTKDAGTLRVVIATDQPALTNKLLVTPDSVALPANQSVNTAQFGGTNVSTGTGAGGAGIPRVTVSNDSSLAANQSVNVNQIGGAAAPVGAGVEATALRVTMATDSTGQVKLAAGSNLAGKFGIDQTTPGTTNAVAIIAGQNGVAGGSGASSATTQRVIHATDDLVVTQTAPLLVASAGGYVRQDSTATIAKESGGNLATIVTQTKARGASAGPLMFPATDTDQTILAANSARVGFRVCNRSSLPMMLRLGGTATPFLFDVRIESNTCYENAQYTGAINAVWFVGADRYATVNEIN